MNTIHKTPQAPAMRLKWLEVISPPLPRQTHPRSYLTALGVGLMLAAIVGVGIAIGIFGTEPIVQYSRQLLELAWPGTH